MTSPTFRHVLAGRLLGLALVLALPAVQAPAQDAASAAAQYVQAHYDKHEYRIPMRDGVRLFTAVYVPTDRSRSYPFLIKRTPYSSRPYGEDAYPSVIGPVGSPRFAEEGYIFVYQDVRGRFESEGTFLNMTPPCPEDAPDDCVDESTDMYDTVAWLLENVQPNNGRVGVWGISYPGFYAAASIINSHPAVRAASPQAPIADWFVGDDFHHRGAFFLQDAFRFFYRFETGERFDFGTDDAYTFYLDLGPLPRANERYFGGRVAFWDSLMQHGTYDAFWQRRNLLPHLKGITSSVLTVGGWFDAEDPYGAVNIYREIEEHNPGIDNRLVLGPWFHGGWVRSDGDYLGNVSFDVKTSRYYQEYVDLPYFNHHLKDGPSPDLPEVLAFATGSNRWRRFDAWPPPDLTPATFYLRADGRLSEEPPTEAGPAASDVYRTDPARPTPYTREITIERTREYMVEDQRFAARRTDVLVYRSDVLEEDVTLAGPVTANLFVTTTGTDADYVVKVIDVYPDSTSEWQAPAEKYMDVPMSGYQMLVRAEVLRAKFRNSYEHPEPLAPGEVHEIRFETPDLLHTFRAGHRIMVQVQSAWFPLVDRNPQTFTDIYSAAEDDFQAATHTIHRSARYPSHIRVGRLEE